MENVNLTGTTPAEEQITQPAAEESAEAAAPQASQAQTQSTGQPSGETAALSDGQAENKPFLSVQFNHVNRDMTREQAIEFAQKGLLFEKLSPIYNKLDYLAAQKQTNISGLVDSMLESAENAYRQKLVEKLGNDTQMIEDMMAYYHSKSQEKYNKLLADRAKHEQEENSRRQQNLAEQFAALQKEFPEVQAVTELPKEVVRTAVEGRMELTAAYLLHKHQEARRIAQAQARAAEQSKKTTGSVQSPENAEAAAVDAFIRGVRTMKF